MYGTSCTLEPGREMVKWPSVCVCVCVCLHVCVCVSVPSCQTEPCEECEFHGQSHAVGDRWKAGQCQLCHCLPNLTVQCAPYCQHAATGCPQVRNTEVYSNSARVCVCMCICVRLRVCSRAHMSEYIMLKMCFYTTVWQEGSYLK